MGTDIKDTYHALASSKYILMDPTSILIVGLDEPATEETKHLIDPDRIAAPINDTIARLIKFGWRDGSFVTIQKIGDKIYAVNGRRRIRACRSINAALTKKQAEAFLRIPCVPDRSNDPLVSLVILNEGALEDTIPAKARKAARLTSMNHTDEEIRVMFDISQQTLNNWRILLKCDPAILKQIEAGKLPPSAGYEIGIKPIAEQKETAAKIEEIPDDVKPRERARRTREANTGTREPTKRWSIAHIQELYALLEPSDAEPYEDEFCELAHKLLGILLGDDDSKGLTSLDEFRCLQTYVKRIARSERV